MSGQFTFAKSDAPGSSSTTMFKTRDSTGNFVSYLSGMELLAADTEDGASFRGQLLKVGYLLKSPFGSHVNNFIF